MKPAMRSVRALDFIGMAALTSAAAALIARFGDQFGQEAVLFQVFFGLLAFGLVALGTARIVQIAQVLATHPTARHRRAAQVAAPSLVSVAPVAAEQAGSASDLQRAA